MTRKTMQSNIKGLYPCGEGAGYAGGIMSAAVDGIKKAEMVAINNGRGKMSSNKVKRNNVYNFIGVLLCIDEYVRKNGRRFAVNTKKLFQKFYSTYYSICCTDKNRRKI